VAFFYSIPETLLTQLSQLSVFRDQADPIMDDFLSQSLTTDKTISPGFSELQQLLEVVLLALLEMLAFLVDLQ